MGLATPFSGTGLGTDKMNTNLYRTGLGQFAGGLVFAIVEATISDARTIAYMDPQVQIINGGVSDRDVTLPAALDGQTFIIVNSGTTNVLTIKNAGGSTIGVVGINQTGIAISGDSTWRFALTLGGTTALSATVAQLNTLAAVTAGTVAASKAVVVDANKDVGTFRYLRTNQLIRSQGAPTSIATAGAETYTIAQLLTGTIVRDCAGGDRTDVLPTAALAVAGVPGCAVGDVVEFLVINGSDAAETITIDAGVGGTYDANQAATSRVIAQNTSKLCRIRFTNVGSGTEAYVAYI